MLVLVFLLACSGLGIAHAADVNSVLQSLAKERAAKTQPLEDPTGALSHFYQALARTAADRPGAVTRIAHFGDSLVEMDLLPGPMRRLMQIKWGDAGHGFVLASQPRAWYRPNDIYFKPSGVWPCLDMVNQNVKDRRFGLGGAICFGMEKKPSITIGTSARGDVGMTVSSMEILFPQSPSGGDVLVKVDKKKYGVLNTQGPIYREASATIHLPDGPHKLELIEQKEGIQLYGVIFERNVPGVVYDALGINGAGVTSYLSMDAGHWEKQLQHRNPDLVIIGLGTNDIYEKLVDDLEIYKQNMRVLIERVKKALPHSSVLYIAPLDRAEKKGSAIVSHSAVGSLVQAQREVAREMEVAFWSTFDAMGGEGSMARWFKATPRLGAGDLFHPTRLGGEVLGEMFYNALMQGFADYLQKSGMPGLPVAPPPDPFARVEVRR